MLHTLAVGLQGSKPAPIQNSKVNTVKEKSMKEIWKDVVGYEGSYKVSNLGNVKSLDRQCGFMKRKGQLLHPSTFKGYKIVGLSLPSSHSTCRVHRLMMIAFVPNPENKPEVNHIDGDKGNNNLNNLEWATSKENIRHFYRIGMMKRFKPVNMYSIDGLFLKRFKSVAGAVREIGIFRHSIYESCTGKRSQAGGYKWKF